MSAYAAFRSRDYRLLATGAFLSSLGQQMLSVAVSWDLYQQTRSPLVLGNVGLVQVAPVLGLALYAGHVADRYDRRRTVILTQVALVIAAVTLSTSGRSVALIYACLFLAGTARAFQGPAGSSFIPQVVGSEELSNAIAWTSSLREIASVGGPALAGVFLATTGSTSVYLIQCACALGTLVCYVLLRTQRAETVALPPMPARKAIAEGVRFVWSDKLILSALSLDMTAVLFGGATALLPIFAVEILHSDVHGLGWLRSAPSLGAVAMAIVTTHSKKILNAGGVLLWAVAGYGVATIGFGLSRSFWLSFLLLVATGALDNISVVLRTSLVQRETPERLRGRVLAVNNIFISCSNQLGAVESGATAAWFGAVTSVVAGGTATLAIVGAFAMWAEKLRRWKQ